MGPMPIPNYNVLKGDPTAGRVVSGRGPHYQIAVQADGGPAALSTGMHALKSEPGGLALDFVRETVGGSAMVSKDAMTLLPKAFPAGHRHNNLNNEAVDLLNRAVADPSGTIGSAFADAGETAGHPH